MDRVSSYNGRIIGGAASRFFLHFAVTVSTTSRSGPSSWRRKAPRWILWRSRNHLLETRFTRFSTFQCLQIHDFDSCEASDGPGLDVGRQLQCALPPLSFVPTAPSLKLPIQITHPIGCMF